MSEKITLSTLPKTWILDLDGTLVKHNGYKEDGYDTLLKGAKDLMKNIKEEDMVIILSSRKEEEREKTEMFLKQEGIRYDLMILEAPYGERIVINDGKPGNLKNTAVGISVKRDEGLEGIEIETDENL